MLSFLATTAQETSLLTGGTGSSMWQSLGGLAVVFGLLFLCLRLLKRFNRRTGEQETNLLAVWTLGPRREIQVLRLGDEVHYIYRHDGAMVLLKQETLQQWDAYKATQKTAPSNDKNFLSKIFPNGLATGQMAATNGAAPQSASDPDLISR